MNRAERRYCRSLHKIFSKNECIFRNEKDPVMSLFFDTHHWRPLHCWSSVTEVLDAWWPFHSFDNICTHFTQTEPSTSLLLLQFMNILCRNKKFSYVIIYPRVVWILCVTAAIVFFIYHISERAWAYFDYNTTVSVNIRYTNQVPFAAVTLCNINTFRYV